LPTCFTKLARLTLEALALVQKSSALSVEDLDDQKLGANAMNKMLGAHARQFGLK